MLSICREVVSKRVCAIAVRKLCTVMNGSIMHDENNQLFFVELNNDGGRAVLEYEKTSPHILDFYHTGVPVTHRGQGIAKHLVKAGFDFAFEKNLKVKPTCSYVQKYVKDNLTEGRDVTCERGGTFHENQNGVSFKKIHFGYEKTKSIDEPGEIC
ncbi:protein NATD1-like [Rhopilema esculentum]|uniref:protein NATD1-like n=1 Tax=Rhopilema esculentum TaxID=499914 RepID=UPI0031D35FEE